MLEAFRAAALAGDVTMEQAKAILASHQASSTSTFWQSRIDSKSGRKYYYNPKTKSSVWALPLGAQLAVAPQDKPHLSSRSSSLTPRQEKRSQSLGTLNECELACGICDADVSGLTHCAKCGALVLVPDEKEASSTTTSAPTTNRSSVTTSSQRASVTEPRNNRPNLRLSLEEGKPTLHRMNSDPNLNVEDDTKSPRMSPMSPPAKTAPTRTGYTPKSSRVSPLADRMRGARIKSESVEGGNNNNGGSSGAGGDAVASPRLASATEPPTPTARTVAPSKPAPKREKSVVLPASPSVDSNDSPTSSNPTSTTSNHNDEKKPSGEYDMQRKPSEPEKKLRENVYVDPAVKFRELTARTKEAKRRSANNLDINPADFSSSFPSPSSSPSPDPSGSFPPARALSLSPRNRTELPPLEELQLPPPPDADPDSEPPPPEGEPPNEVEEDNSVTTPSHKQQPSRRKLVRTLDDVEDMVIGSEASDESVNTRNNIESELLAYIESLRPQYGDGQLAKEPDKLLKNFFVQMINIPESKRHLVFHEFFLSVFWHENVLQELLKYGSWKQWLLILISEAQTTSDEILDYVLMTLIGMCGYFFRKYSEVTNSVSKLDTQGEALPLGFGTEMRSMRDFLIDATTEIDKHSQGISLRVLSGTAVKIVAWDNRPSWVAPDFACAEWQNLFSMLEAQEEYLFFPLPDRQFTLPDTPDFPGITVVESTIAMLEKIKVHQLDAVPETAPELARLQKLYAAKGTQELEFFRGLRDFFAFYGQIDCMEIQKAGFTIRTKVPVNCSISEFCHLLQNRKRIEYQRVQKKVAEYLKIVREHYKKVFSGEIAFTPRVDGRGGKRMSNNVPSSRESRDDSANRSHSVSGLNDASTPRRSHVRGESGLSRVDKHSRQSSIRVGETRLL